jgi:hypothetical protein
MPYQINGIVVRTHRGMDVELGVHDHDPNADLMHFLTLAQSRGATTSTVPSRDALGTMLKRHRY